MKPTDVTVLGELNIDLLFNEMNQFPETGKEILSNDMELSLGSSSAIFAANLSALGTRVQFMGKLGKDLFGQFILSRLEERNVNTNPIIIDPKGTTGATVVLNKGQDRAMVTHPGAMATFRQEDINWNIINESRHLHISSIFLQPEINKHILSILHLAKAAGLTTSLDPQWDPTEKWNLPLGEMLPLLDFFMPNEKEICLLTGSASLTEAISSLSPLNSTLVIKMGEKGSLVVNAHYQRLLTVQKTPNFIDAIGAGDSFNAGFIHKWLNGASLESCQEFGNACGAFSTTHAGGINAFNNTTKLYASATAIA
jgi:sugar/nucleoside kinase (ribokinase family)